MISGIDVLLLDSSPPGRTAARAAGSAVSVLTKDLMTFRRPEWAAARLGVD